jgi:hypothetical protein
MNVFMIYNKDNMKKIVFLLMFLPLISFSQNWIDDTNFDKTIKRNSTFNDDKVKIVVVEFWAKFNNDNSFKEWKNIKGAKYYRCDIAASPVSKKQYKIRMAPTLIIFKDGIPEEKFKAGLDLTCPVTLTELQSAIEGVKKASQF